MNNNLARLLQVAPSRWSAAIVMQCVVKKCQGTATPWQVRRCEPIIDDANHNNRLTFSNSSSLVPPYYGPLAGKGSESLLYPFPLPKLKRVSPDNSGVTFFWVRFSRLADCNFQKPYRLRETDKPAPPTLLRFSYPAGWWFNRLRLGHFWPCLVRNRVGYFFQQEANNV